MPDDFTALWRRLRHRRVVLGGRCWVIAALVENGAHPWVWLVDDDRPEVQARYPASGLAGMA